MKFKFKIQQYQTDAVESTVDIFAGRPSRDGFQYRRDLGKRIKEDVLYDQRAEYGKQVLKDIADRLTQRFGFTEDEIMYALRTQLTWTHLRSLTAIKV